MRQLLTLILSSLLLSEFAVGDIRLDKLRYVGCFDLSYSLSKNYHEHMPLISLEGCLDICATKGSTRYVGIESSDNFCYCGSDIAEESSKKEDPVCNILCSDVSNRTCGGDWLMSVYDTTNGTAAQANNDSVSFLIGLSEGIRVYNSTNLAEFDTVMLTGGLGWAYTVDYHFARRLVYANTKGKLIMVNVSSSFGTLSSTPSLIRAMSLCDGFAVDWVMDKIYWADCSTQRPPYISRLGLDGSNNEVAVALDGSPRSIKRMEIDPYSRMIFWLADGVIESFNLTDKNFHANVSESGAVVRALALDRSLKRVYYVGVVDESTPLFSMDYRGNGQIKVFSVAKMTSVFGLGIHGGYVYWINYAMSTDIMYNAPLKIGGGKNTTMLQTINKAVWHMRVVHPDIQTAPEESVCSRKNCSHFCEELSSTSAICQCPEGFSLAGDKVSCESDVVLAHSSEPMSYVIAHTTPSTTTETSHYGEATYVGCFGTSYAFEKRYNKKIPMITLDKCIQRCVELRTDYAGIGARDKYCYCGSDLAAESNKVRSYLCNDRCPGVQDLRCGGDWLMSLYDIRPMIPQGGVDDMNKEEVMFLVGHSDSVKLYNSSDLRNPKELMKTQNDWAYGVDYHYEKNLMFASTRKALYSGKLFPDTESGLSYSKLFTMGTCEAFAVDWVHDRIFWVDCSGSSYTLKVVDLQGKNSTNLWMGWEDVVVKRMSVDPYSGIIFWLKDNVIESCETTGAYMRTNVSSPEVSVRGLTLDVSSQRLFYIGLLETGAGLFSTDYHGNNLKNHLEVPQMRGIYGFGLVSGYAYWISYLNMDVLYKAHIDSGSSAKIRQMKTFSTDSTVWHMRVVDPELQKLPESKLCSSDSSSCLVEQPVALERNSVAGDLLLGVGVVLAVLLSVGVLMYLTDIKYWDVIRSKVSRVPYARERGEPNAASAYHASEDNVNLI